MLITAPLFHPNFANVSIGQRNAEAERFGSEETDTVINEQLANMQYH